MKTSIFVRRLCALLSTFVVAGGSAAQTLHHPNIIVIVADDMGWNVPGYHNGFVHTPNIDHIAHEGVELNRFYVSPICSPTRAGLMTGRYAMHLGMARTVVRPWSNFGLPTEEQTVADMLAEAGYAHRAAFGKWHLGHLDAKWHPLSRGFTYYKGCYNGAIDYFTRDREGQIDWHENWNDIDEDGYTTDLIADSAVKYISSHAKSGPMFCYVAFTAPHEPLEAPQKYLDDYANLKNPDKRKLAAMTECMDDGIGRILKSIHDAGIARDTFIWFLSDNGGIPKIPQNNAPLHGVKDTVYEGGVRVPAAVWWPGVIQDGRRISTPLLNVDLLPTLAKIAGTQPKAPVAPLDGSDTFDLLASDHPGDALRTRDLYFFTGQGGSDREQIAVTTPDGWKLIAIGPDVRQSETISSATHRVQLFNVLKDPNETTDLAASEPTRVAELGKKLIAFRKSEPDHALTVMNHKPDDFHVPPHWHNAP